MSLRPFFVTPSDAAPEELVPFGIRVKRYDDRGPYFKAEHDMLWKGTCAVRVFDDGRVVVHIANHATADEQQVCLSLAERAFKGGQAMCRRAGWDRKRKSKVREIAFYENYYWLRIYNSDPHHGALRAAIATPNVQIDADQLKRVDGFDRQITTAD